MILNCIGNNAQLTGHKMKTGMTNERSLSLVLSTCVLSVACLVLPDALHCLWQFSLGLNCFGTSRYTQPPLFLQLNASSPSLKKNNRSCLNKPGTWEVCTNHFRDFEIQYNWTALKFVKKRGWKCYCTSRSLLYLKESLRTSACFYGVKTQFRLQSLTSEHCSSCTGRQKGKRATGWRPRASVTLWAMTKGNKTKRWANVKNY